MALCLNTASLTVSFTEVEHEGEGKAIFQIVIPFIRGCINVECCFVGIPGVSCFVWKLWIQRINRTQTRLWGGVSEIGINDQSWKALESARSQSNFVEFSLTETFIISFGEPSTSPCSIDAPVSTFPSEKITLCPYPVCPNSPYLNNNDRLEWT